MAEAMTAEQAQSFERGQSLTHYAMLLAEAARRGCNCVPYEDWFTYKRWKAQGFQVQRGEKGFALATFIPAERDEDGKITSKSRPWNSYVFCKCQVKPIVKEELFDKVGRHPQDQAITWDEEEKLDA